MLLWPQAVNTEVSGAATDISGLFGQKPCISIFLPCCNVKRIFMEQIWEN